MAILGDTVTNTNTSEAATRLRAYCSDILSRLTAATAVGPSDAATLTLAGIASDCGTGETFRLLTGSVLQAAQGLRP